MSAITQDKVTIRGFYPIGHKRDYIRFPFIIVRHISPSFTADAQMGRFFIIGPIIRPVMHGVRSRAAQIKLRNVFYLISLISEYFAQIPGNDQVRHYKRHGLPLFSILTPLNSVRYMLKKVNRYNIDNTYGI